MAWRLVRGRERQAGRAAVMRGPVVFCLNPAQDKSLKNMDGADLGTIVLDPTSLQEVSGGDAIRPGGVACKLKASRGEFDIGCSGDLPLVLTEFSRSRRPLHLLPPTQLERGDARRVDRRV